MCGPCDHPTTGFLKPLRPMAAPRSTTATPLILFLLLSASLGSASRSSLLPDFIQAKWPPRHFDTISDALVLNPFLSFLRRALNCTTLYQDFEEPSFNATILAPTNQAFGELLYDLEMTERQLFEDNVLLMKVLQYHVIPAVAVKADDIRDGAVYPTLLADQSVTFYRESYFFFTKITVQGTSSKSSPAMIIFPDVSAAKSIIHIVNKVVLPSGL